MGQPQLAETLDGFFGHAAPKPKPPEKRCANPKCRKILKGTTYTLTVKGKQKDYCQDCAKAILRPRENSEENI